MKPWQLQLEEQIADIQTALILDIADECGADWLQFLRQQGSLDPETMEVEQLRRHVDFLRHMFSAYENGDRFIVAKLAWNGEA